MNTLRLGLMAAMASVAFAPPDAALSGKTGSNKDDITNMSRKTGGDENLPGTGYDAAKLAGVSRKVPFFIHKEGVPDTVELSPSGRLITETHELPDWMPDGAYMADLAERNNFYQTRLGADRAEKAGLATNIINVDDVAWLCIDPEGDGKAEIVVPASTEFRNAVLMKVLGVSDEGDIDGAILDHYIAQDGKGYTLEELEAQQRTEQAAFGQSERKTGTTE